MQLSRHVIVKLHEPAAFGVPVIVAPEALQVRLKPLQLEGVQLVLVYGRTPPDAEIDWE